MKTTFEDLERTVAAREMEARTQEFKGALPPSNDREKKEFLKDVSSMANSIGGKIIFGIEEDRDENQKLGCAKGLVQFTLGELAKSKELFLNWLSSGCDPKIPGVTIHEVINPIDPQSGLLVVDIPQSWIPPHMVRETGHFYYRTSGGCDRMDTAQLRDLFLVAAGIATQSQRFQTDRLGKIMAGEMPLALKEGPTFVIHCIPLSAFSRQPKRISFNPSDTSLLQPPGNDQGVNGRRNFDGYLTSPGYKSAPSYLQAYSNGILEGVTQLFHGFNNEGEIGAYVLERALQRMLQTTFEFFETKDISAPFACIPSLLRVKGMVIPVPSQSVFLGHPTPIDRDTLVLPEIIFETLDRNLLVNRAGGLSNALIPTVDALWHACGYDGRIEPSR